MADHIARRLHAPGPKRMLALDGGGTRGTVSIAFLEQIEATLKTKLGRQNDPKFCLADYFDLIGGTSVGSILATLLALGWKVADIKLTFDSWAPQIFRPNLLAFKGFRVLYDAEALAEKVEGIVRDRMMKSEDLQTGLCIISKRADTGSPWVMTNNPKSRYWTSRGNRAPNSDYKLKDVIRASTAAPTYFHPQEIVIFRGRVGSKEIVETGSFVDGAVSPHNNPALQLLMLAGMKGYNLGGGNLDEGGQSWPLGAGNLMMISIGTGNFATRVKPAALPGMEAVDAMLGMMGDCSDLGLSLLQWMSNPRFCWQIDREIGDNASDNLGPDPLLAFQRYDIVLEDYWLEDNVRAGVKMGPKLKELLKVKPIQFHADLPKLQQLIAVDQMPRLYEIAAAAALDQVDARDFPGLFDR